MIPRGREPVRLNPRVWWLGRWQSDDFTRSNAYLVLEDNRGILINPGSVPDFPALRSALSTLLEPGKLSAIAVTHPAPETCSSLRLWEEAGFTGKIIGHWKTTMFLSSYGTVSRFKHIYREEPEEIMSLRFVPAPFVYAPGSLLIFDTPSATLFSGALFSCFGRGEALIDEPAALKRVIEYHEQFMGGGQALSDALSLAENLRPTLICPQHGCVHASGISGLYQGLRKVQCGRSGSGTNQIDGDIARELERIKAEHQRLRENVVLGHDDALRDSLTGLYNQGYLKAYLPRFVQSAPEGAMACLRLDGMKAYNDEFGFDSGDEAIRGFSAMVVENRPEEVLVIRDSGPALLLLFRNEEEAIPETMRLQRLLAGSGAFKKPMTCGAALSFTAVEKTPQALEESLRERIRILDGLAPGSLCVASVRSPELRTGAILFIEPDRRLSRLFEEYFAKRRYEVLRAETGEEALRAIAHAHPSVTVCASFIPQSDPLALFEAFSRNLGNPTPPFILLTEQKTESQLRHAFDAGIRHVYQKPIMLAELECVIDALRRDGDAR